MKTTPRRRLVNIVAAAIAVALLLVSATEAFARPVRAVPGNAPSKTHAGGTIFVGWLDAGHVMLGEWGIAEKKLLKKQQVRQALDVRLSRSGDRLIMISSGDKLEVVSFDLDLRERKAMTLSTSTSTSSTSTLDPVLDSNEAYILAGNWQQRAPRRAAVVVGRDMRIEPTEALSLHVIDAATLKVVGARTFEGDHLFMPLFAFEQQRVARLGTGQNAASAYIALPEEQQARITKVALPTLATEREHVITNLHLTRASASLELVDSNLLVHTVDELRLLHGTTLQPIGPSPRSRGNSTCFVYDSARRVLVTEALAPPSIGPIPVVENRNERASSTLLIAFGKHIVVTTAEDDETQWGVAILR